MAEQLRRHGFAGSFQALTEAAPIPVGETLELFRLQVPPDSDERLLETQLLYARAMLAIEHEDLAAGERDLRTIIAADPDSADALNALGYTLADSHRPFE